LNFGKDTILDEIQNGILIALSRHYNLTFEQLEMVDKELEYSFGAVGDYMSLDFDDSRLDDLAIDIDFLNNTVTITELF